MRLYIYDLSPTCTLLIGFVIFKLQKIQTKNPGIPLFD